MWNTDAEIVDTYVEHFDSGRGVVREELVDRHLREQLGEDLNGRHIVDFGSGAGQQTLRFVERGCNVTLVEPSPLMMDRAKSRLERLPGELSDRVTMMQATAEDAAAQLPKGAFDAVLSHGVLMYLDSPEPLLTVMVEAAKPGGLVSVLTKSSEALAARAGLQGDFTTALSILERESLDRAETTRGWLGVDTRGDSVAGLTDCLARLGADRVAWHGVGVFSDHRDDLDGRSVKELATLVDLEYRAGRLDPYRGIARLIHVLARRT